MNTTRNLTASQAATALGVTIKALRQYEERGLIEPDRSPVGWRLYTPAQMENLRLIVALRRLGMGAGAIAALEGGDAVGLEIALARHELRLREEAGDVSRRLSMLNSMRASLRDGSVPNVNELAVIAGGSGLSLAFDLDWPWAGEAFVMNDLGSITFVTGPLGSGKTRFVKAVTKNLPGARFAAPDCSVPECDEGSDAIAQLKQEGIEPGDAMKRLVHLVSSAEFGHLVIDHVERGLSEVEQEAFIAWLRGTVRPGRGLVLLTRSTGILDCDAPIAGERAIFCPASHEAPFEVPMVPGARGWESLTDCLASPATNERVGTLEARRAA